MKTREELLKRLARCKQMLENMERDYERAKARVEADMEDINLMLREV